MKPVAIGFRVQGFRVQASEVVFRVQGVGFEGFRF